MVAITKFQREHIFDAVRLLYTELAQTPEKAYHFPKGRPACRHVGYPEELLETLPERVVESFAGVGYPFASNVIKKGHHVLDIGSGSGTDVMITAREVTDAGKVYALDLTQAMLDKLRSNMEHAEISHVEYLFGNAEEIPVPDACVDVVTSNGVLNLIPNKGKACEEIMRILRPGGHIQIADIVIGENAEKLDESKANPRLWAECIVGAVEQQAYLDMFREHGFKDVTLLNKFDYFAESPNPTTRDVAADFGAHAIVLTAQKPI